MDVKDYYAILQLEPSAGMQEVKQAYRRLAKLYHPDKKTADVYAAVEFAAIKEAYEVLTNPAKKEYYLQQRWYNQSMGKRRKQEIITPYTVLQQSLELDRYVSTLDVFRMDKEGLKDYIMNLLPDDTIQKLQAFNEPEICRQITGALLRAAKPLPHLYLKDITKQLYTLSVVDDEAKKLINAYVKKETKKYSRERFSLLAILIITTLICILIWLAG